MNDQHQNIVLHPIMVIDTNSVVDGRAKRWAMMRRDPAIGVRDNDLSWWQVCQYVEDPKAEGNWRQVRSCRWELSEEPELRSMIGSLLEAGWTWRCRKTDGMIQEEMRAGGRSV